MMRNTRLSVFLRNEVPALQGGLVIGGVRFRGRRQFHVFWGIWSRNSCDPSFAMSEQPAKPFTTLNQANSFASWSGWRKEQDIALALMISLMMKMLYILCQCMAERRFPCGQKTYPAYT